MELYQATIDQITRNDKMNLMEKLYGANRFEFQLICRLLTTQYHVKADHLIGLGTSCIVYQNPMDSTTVIKVCAKKIKFFHHYRDQSACHFQQTVNPMTPYLLPIRQIIYDGTGFFAYIQDKCQPLDKHKLTSKRRHLLYDVLSIIESMLSHGFICGQIKPKNVGYAYSGQKQKRQLTLFDYHSLHPLKQRIKEKPTWNHSLIESLEVYLQSTDLDHCDHRLANQLRQLIDQIQHIRDYDSHQINEVIKTIGQIKNRIKEKKR